MAKSLPQTVQWYDRSPVCTRMCFVRTDRLPNAFRQIVHSNGLRVRQTGSTTRANHIPYLSPVWIRACLLRLHFCVNVFMQTSQVNGRSGLWTRMWRSTCARVGNTLSHWLHGNSCSTTWANMLGNGGKGPRCAAIIRRDRAPWDKDPADRDRHRSGSARPTSSPPRGKTAPKETAYRSECHAQVRGLSPIPKNETRYTDWRPGARLEAQSRAAATSPALATGGPRRSYT